MPLTMRLWREWPRAVAAVLVAAALLVLLGVVLSAGGSDSKGTGNVTTVRVSSVGPSPAHLNSHASAAAAAKIHSQAQQITDLTARLSTESKALARTRAQLARTRKKLHARHSANNHRR